MKKISFQYAVHLLIIHSSILIISSCSVQQQISRSAAENVLTNKALTTAHVGISIYEPATGKYWYNYQGDKYFVPASNTKIPTCYAAMKYLGDSLVGLRYGIPEEKGFKENVIVIKPTGDPTFLHFDYKEHPAFNFLRTISKQKQQIGYCIHKSKVERWGSGWSWNDYDAAYMAERNVFPVFGNIIRARLNDSAKRVYRDTILTPGKLKIGQLVKTQSRYFDSLINTHSPWVSIDNARSLAPKLEIERSIADNWFTIKSSNNIFSSANIPFVTNQSSTTLGFLKDTLGKGLRYAVEEGNNKYLWDEENSDINIITIQKWHKIHSHPTDSLLKPMMHRSDNFFAEQSLLMVSNEMLGVMNDAKIIDTILKTDFKDLPQKPRWVDGSGLSRYNLFTPQSMVAILHKMQKEFPMERIKEIFPTGGEGTISSYYKADSGYIYAKTGTLSGVIAFSGFLYTKKGKLLIFSTMVNNHQAGATDVRRAIEKFLQEVRSKL